ncbi:MAG: hypothetical protein HY319_21385 [Armatimonadetes bacterium]|nr:hypothetical protein [Armatimonadota bacterium]
MVAVSALVRRGGCGLALLGLGAAGLPMFAHSPISMPLVFFGGMLVLLTPVVARSQEPRGPRREWALTLLGVLCAR